VALLKVVGKLGGDARFQAQVAANAASEPHVRTSPD